MSGAHHPTPGLDRIQQQLSIARDEHDAPARTGAIRAMTAGVAIPANAGMPIGASSSGALQRIADQLRRAGATLPISVTLDAPTIETSIGRGLSLALCLVEVEIETCNLGAMRSNTPASVLVNWHQHIKAARESTGMTPARLAELVDVTPDVIDRWESGEVRTIDGATLMDVCAALNIDPGWVLGADDA